MRTNNSKRDAIHSAIRSLHANGYVVDSCGEALPPAIRPGNPVRAAIKQLRTNYPQCELPVSGRRVWKRVVRLSRRRDNGVYEAVDDFLCWLNRELDDIEDTNESDEAPDGLIKLGFQLKWANRVIDLQPQIWRLLELIWNETCVEQGELEERLWWDTVAQGTVTKAVSRANAALRSAGVPWSLHLKNGFLKKSARHVTQS